MNEKRRQIFQEVADDIDATWTHVTLFGGMVDGAYDDYTKKSDGNGRKH